uniref:C2H2-type domain-containing protein n=1 Tax=Periophthalmus magnuspinnatus TaxID=409849 RepID=A0A3B4B935_9GOBI
MSSGIGVTSFKLTFSSSTEFSTLDAFIQHKLHKNCKRETGNQVMTQIFYCINIELLYNCIYNFNMNFLQVAESNGSFPNVKTLESMSNINDGVIRTDAILLSPLPPTQTDDNSLGRGQRRKRPSHKATNQSHRTDRSPSDSGAETDKNDYTVNTDGRYLCGVCEKTFKTVSYTLLTHLKTHTDEKNFKCELCNTSFRTKGSLIRHNRRHTDERPYRCNLCGQSFRESGALTRHLKSLTPCTEKIRFVQYKEILVSKDGYKPFKCTICQKDFLSGYLLKKHMEVHVSERRYKCGECGKLYKTIGHVREHMRAHSDERPYHCNKCDRGYKTKWSTYKAFQWLRLWALCIVFRWRRCWERRQM